MLVRSEDMSTMAMLHVAGMQWGAEWATIGELTSSLNSKISKTTFSYMIFHDFRVLMNRRSEHFAGIGAQSGDMGARCNRGPLAVLVRGRR